MKKSEETPIGHLSMFKSDRFKNIPNKLRRHGLLLAFLFGFFASVISFDPKSVLKSVPNSVGDLSQNTNPELNPDSQSETPVEVVQRDGVSDSPNGNSAITDASSTASVSMSVSSIGGIDGVSEAGSAHPFDRAYPRSEPEESGPTASRAPASLRVWEGDDSLQRLKFDDDEPLWNGTAQLLPNPMFVEQLTSKRMKQIRGGGWLAIDISRGEILPVELFKSGSANYTSRAVIEAKVVRIAQNGQERVLNPVNTGIPIVRGVSGVEPGTYEVPETPACLVRYSVVTKEEICSAPRPRSGGGAQLRFRFEPAVAPSSSGDGKVADPVAADSDFHFTTVYVETPAGKWLEIGNFNESFTPIGDANRDGYPDFYLESLSDSSSGGRHDLVMSSLQGNDVTYTTYSARFIGR